MKEHAYAQPLKWKLSDCGLWHWQLKPKRLTTCIRAPPEWRVALRLFDRSCEILLPIDAPCSDFCPGAPQNLIAYLSTGWRMYSKSAIILEDAAHGLYLIWHHCFLWKGIPMWVDYSFHFPTIFLSLLYYLLPLHIATVYCSPQKS